MKGWETKRLGDILQLEYGKPLDEKDRNSRGRFPVYGANGEKDRSDKYYIDKPSIIVGRKGSAGEVNLTERKFWPLDVTYFVTFDDKQHDLKFLYHLLTELELPKLAKGVKPGLNRNEVYAIETLAPPLAEQQRIVRVLDEAFAGLVTAQAHAKKNLQNARAIFEGHLQSVFSHRGKVWAETTLGEAYDVRDGTHDSPKYHAAGYPLITSKNLKREGLSFEDVKFINETDYNEINKRSAVHKGDVLFAMIGTIGNPTLVEIEPTFAIKNVALFKVPKNQNSRFLKYYLDSEWVTSKMTADAKGATQKFVGLGYLRSFPICLPTQEVQNAVVEELNALATQVQRLTWLYEQKQAALLALRRSLLHQAFIGEL